MASYRRRLGWKSTKEGPRQGCFWRDFGAWISRSRPTRWRRRRDVLGECRGVSGGFSSFLENWHRGSRVYKAKALLRSEALASLPAAARAAKLDSVPRRPEMNSPRARGRVVRTVFPLLSPQSAGEGGDPEEAASGQRSALLAGSPGPPCATATASRARAQSGSGRCQRRAGRAGGGRGAFRRRAVVRRLGTTGPTLGGCETGACCREDPGGFADGGNPKNPSKERPSAGCWSGAAFGRGASWWLWRVRHQLCVSPALKSPASR